MSSNVLEIQSKVLDCNIQDPHRQQASDLKALVQEYQ